MHSCRIYKGGLSQALNIPEPVFSAGTYTDAIRIDYETFANLERPVVGCPDTQTEIASLTL